MSDRPALKSKDAPDLGRFDWEDPFRLAEQLSEEERMLAEAARAYAQGELQPRVIDAFREEKTDPEIFREMGEMGLLGVTIPEEYGGIGASYVAYGLIAREVERVDSGYRSDDERAVEPGDVPDLCLWQRGAAAEVSAEAGARRVDRLFRADRAGCGQRPGGDEDRREEDRGRLCAFGLEDVDFQCADRGCLRGLGEVRGAWRQDPRLRAGKGDEGAERAEDRRQAVACAPRSPARS